MTARHGLVATTFALSLFYSGVIYGWTALVPILKSKSYNAFDGRTEPLTAVMTIASSITAGSGLLVGIILDRFGPRYTMALAGVMTTSGSVLMSFGDRVSYLLYPAYGSIAFGGMLLLISSFRVAFVFPKHLGTLIGVISCLFDASTGVFVLFKVLFQTFDLWLRDMFLVYAVGGFVLHVMAFAFWSRCKDWDTVNFSSKDTGEKQESRMSLLAGGVDDAGQVPHLGPQRRAYVPVAERPFTVQVRSREFAYIYVFCVVCMFRSNMYLGTTYNFLESLNAPDIYLTVCASIVPLGFVIVPVFSYVLGNHGFASTGHLCWLLGVTYGILSLFPDYVVQVVTAFVFTCYRAVLFSYVAAFVASIFGAHSVGRVTGILYTTTACFVALQYPMVTFVVNNLSNNYVPLHWLLLGIMTPVVMVSVWIQCTSQEVGPPEKGVKRVDSSLERRPSFAVSFSLTHDELTSEMSGDAMRSNSSAALIDVTSGGRGMGGSLLSERHSSGNMVMPSDSHYGSGRGDR